MVLTDLSASARSNFPNVTSQLTDQVDYVVAYYYASMQRPGFWPVNSPGLAPAWFGPLEINMDYYASWQGDDRILVIPIDQAYELDILLLEE